MKTVFLVSGVIAGIIFLSSSSCDHKKAIESVDQKYEGAGSILVIAEAMPVFLLRKIHYIKNSCKLKTRIISF